MMPCLLSSDGWRWSSESSEAQAACVAACTVQPCRHDGTTDLACGQLRTIGHQEHVLRPRQPPQRDLLDLQVVDLFRKGTARSRLCGRGDGGLLHLG